MKASDRSLCDELRQLAATLPLKQAEALHAAAQRLRELSKGQPAPPRLRVPPPAVNATPATSLPAKAEQRTGDRHAGR